MEQNFVTADTLVGEIVVKYPESEDFLMDLGMHCLGCPASQGESLGDAAMVHGLDSADVVKALNEKIAEGRANA